MTIQQADSVKLQETINQGGVNVTVDWEAGIIRGVKVLGESSKNGRRYPKATREKAAGLYEGCQVYIDHGQSNGRSVRDLFGELQNVQEKGDGLYGDLPFLKSHQMAKQICEAAQRFAARLGLSHDAEGSMIKENGGNVVEAITAVNSVDFVSKPASVKGLFESESEDTMEKKTVRQVFEEHAPAKENATSLLKEMDAAIADTPVEVPVDAIQDAAAQLKQAVQTAVQAAMSDDSIDVVGLLKKGQKLLADMLAALLPVATDDAADADDAGEGGDTDAGEGATMESLLQGFTDKLTLLEQKIDGIQAKQTKRPTFSPPVSSIQESKETPKTPKEFATAIRD